MTARYATADLQHAAQGRGLDLSFNDANTLRRAEKTLHRWAEEECNGTIQRPWAGQPVSGLQGTGDGDARPYRPTCIPGVWARIPDREKGALRRVAAICDRLGAFYYHQTDPRGCALYVSTEPLTDSAYSNGIACSR